MSNVDPLNRACKCERCGEWWYQGTSHQCNSVSQLDEAVRDRDMRVNVLLRQMDELLADITHRDHLIAELKAQINDAGDTDIDWYRQELSQSTVVLKDLRKQIAELEERLSACHEGAQVRAEVAVAKERQRILSVISRMGINPSIFVAIQANIMYPTQDEAGKIPLIDHTVIDNQDGTFTHILDFEKHKRGKGNA